VAAHTHTAIDIALLLPDALSHPLTALNSTLRAPPDGFHFDSTHLPHLTLVQQFARQHDLEAIAGVLDEVVEHQAPLALATTHISCAHVSSTLGVELTGELATLHRRLMECLEPFCHEADRNGAEDAFWTNGNTPRLGRPTSSGSPPSGSSQPSSGSTRTSQSESARSMHVSPPPRLLPPSSRCASWAGFVPVAAS
jgi:hypothetical protein